MRRALQLAANGEGKVSPNPMVGAVIVADQRIIGEGFHAFYGGSHAEVNAINSVAEEDKHLLKASTIYVTLEPCAHFGKTPPCANLIVETGIPNVVVGCLDPNPKVAGKGIEILKKAGVNVTTGMLEKECKALNPHFLTAHSQGRAYVTLKWAMSADGYLADIDENNNPLPLKFSSPLSAVWMHRERARHDMILVGANTEKTDHPLLNVRYWGGNSPRKYVASKHINPQEFVKEIRKEGVNSLLVEGGAAILSSFIKDNVYDEIRIEVSPVILGKGIKAPEIPQNVVLSEFFQCRHNLIQVFKKYKI